MDRTDTDIISGVAWLADFSLLLDLCLFFEAFCDTWILLKIYFRNWERFDMTMLFYKHRKSYRSDNTIARSHSC